MVYRANNHMRLLADAFSTAPSEPQFLYASTFPPPSLKIQFLKSISQPEEGSREEGEEWMMGILRDPTGSLGSGASQLPQATPGWVH